MNIEVSWDNPQKTAIRWSFPQDWNWEDFAYAWQQAQKLLPNGDIIADFAECTGLPDDEPSENLVGNTFLTYIDTDSLIILSGCNDTLTNTILDWINAYPALRQIIAFVETIDEGRIILDYTYDEAMSTDHPEYVIQWQILERVIYIELASDLTPEALSEFNREIIALLDSVDGRVCIIWDFVSLELMRGNVLAIREKLTFINHPNLTWLIILSANSVIKFSIELLSQFSSISPLYHRNLEEALDFLLHIGFLAE